MIVAAARIGGRLGQRFDGGHCGAVKFIPAPVMADLPINALIIGDPGPLLAGAIEQ